MRAAIVLTVLVLGCGSDSPSVPDARLTADATVRGPPDAPEPPDAATCPRTLLRGGASVTSQGWSVVSEGPNRLTPGVDTVDLETSTDDMARTGGQLLIYLPEVFAGGTATRIQVVLAVDRVDPHNQFDAAAAIMGSFTPNFGDSLDRAEMIYIDPTAVGFADDTDSFAAAADTSFHTYELFLDEAGTAHFSVDGVQAFHRDGFVTDGTLAIGDQTNEANLDSTLRIRSVTKLCP